MKNIIVHRLSLILFLSGIVSAPLHMVTSTTSTSPTTTGECVAELEYGFQEKLLIIVLMINSNSASKSDLTCFHMLLLFFYNQALTQHLLVLLLQVRIILD